MWARVVEVMFGCWLAMSPLIFQRADAELRLWLTDLASATIVIALALLSYRPALKHAHLGTIVVALFLLGDAYLRAPYPTPPPEQNHVLMAYLLAMFALIPNEATLPPESVRTGRAEQ